MMKLSERGMVFFLEHFIGLIESLKLRCHENAENLYSKTLHNVIYLLKNLVNLAVFIRNQTCVLILCTTSVYYYFYSLIVVIFLELEIRNISSIM